MIGWIVIAVSALGIGYYLGVEHAKSKYQRYARRVSDSFPENDEAWRSYMVDIGCAYEMHTGRARTNNPYEVLGAFSSTPNVYDYDRRFQEPAKKFLEYLALCVRFTEDCVRQGPIPGQMR